MSVPFQLGTQASPPISVTTNGPAPTLTVRATALVTGSTIATAFERISGTHTLPPTTAGSPTAVDASLIVAATASVAGSIRTSVLAVVAQIASSDTAVQAAPSTGIVLLTEFVAGSMRKTPCAPVAQMEPNPLTTPIAEPSGKRFTTLFTFG